MKDEKQEAGSSSGSAMGYRVEVRDRSFSVHHDSPRTLQDGVVGPDWRDVRFAEGPNPAGIPHTEPDMALAHLLNYEAAVALAWTVIAQDASQTYGHTSLECRLVQYRLRYERVVTKNGVVAGEPIQMSLIRKELVAEEPTPATDAPGTGEASP